MPGVLAICGLKGGTGKTVLSIKLATRLSKYYGHRVLLVDMGNGADLTQLVCESDESVAGSACRSLLHGNPLPVIPISKDFDLSPGDAAAPLYFSRENPLLDEDAPFLLRKAIAAQSLRKRYDWIIIDTPSSPGLQLFAALAAADCYLQVVIPDLRSPASLVRLMEIAAMIREVYGGRLKQSGIILNRLVCERRSDSIFKNALADTFGEALSVVRETTAMRTGFRKREYRYGLRVLNDDISSIVKKLNL